MPRWTDLAPRQEHTANQGANMVEVRGVVIHIAEGGYEGTISWQKNPASDVSSHFIAGRNDGERCQMVDTAVAAWTQVDGNGHWLSIENAGNSGQTLTDNQLEFAAQILARAHRDYTVPLQIATSPSGRGLGHHSMGGVAWGNHPNCPGSPIIAQKPAIVARAQEIVNGDEMSGDDSKRIEATNARVQAEATGVATYKTTWSGQNPNADETNWLVTQVNALSAKIDALHTTGLTDAQIAAIAAAVIDQLRAHPLAPMP